MRWAVIGIFVLAAPALWAEDGTTFAFFDRPLYVGAHRGGAMQWPENTAYAYGESAKLSPTILLEADVYTTADGHVVVMHDGAVDRTTNGEGAIANLTFEAIRELDAGYRFTRDGGATYPHRGTGLKVPTLEEVLAAAPDHRFLIETKDGTDIVAKTISIIRGAKAEQRVLLASFKPEHMKQAGEIAPEIPRCFDFTTGMRLLAALRGDRWESYSPDAQCLSLSKKMIGQFKLTADDIAKLNERAVLTQVHTINQREEMDRMLVMGFKSILSDDPIELQAAVTAFTANGEK